MKNIKLVFGILGGLAFLLVVILMGMQAIVARQHSDQAAQIADVVVQDEHQIATAEGQELLEMAQYVEANFFNRDCFRKIQFNDCAEWMIEKLTEVGYTEEVIQKQKVTIQYLGVSRDSYNLICTKLGTSGKKIIVGAHMDGSGATDNISGMLLALYEACQLVGEETEDTIEFIFFTGEEYGLFGSQAYVDALSEEERAQIKCMINIDSIGLGDKCYLYGGAWDETRGEVVNTHFFDLAYALSEKLELGLEKNPWSQAHPAPNGEVAAESPMTLEGVSDHDAFNQIGIPTIYLEATNWEVGDYDGYTDTESCGGIMNMENDTLAFGDQHFPGRYLDHLSRYQKFLDALLRNPF